MKQSIQEIIKEAKEQGFPTKVSQKDALDTLNSQYVKIEDATRNHMLDSGQYSQDDYYDLPMGLYQVREKHLRIFNKHGGAKIVIDVSNLVALHKRVKDIPVIRRAKKKVERVVKTDRAATHKGECQICGRHMKLPQGHLSIHGYTVEQYGCFMGTCPGSINLPYEKSCKMLKNLIPSQRDAVIGIKIRIEGLKNDTSVAYYRVRRGPGYVWAKVNVTIEDKLVRISDPVTECKYFGSTYGIHSETVEDARKQLNQRFIKHGLEFDIKKIQGWIEWAQKRVDNWVEKDLEAL